MRAFNLCGSLTSNCSQSLTYRKVMLPPFLRAMCTTPLEVLVLEGLEYSFGSPKFTNEIATTFPNLHGSTLIIRANDRQKENKSATWTRRPVCALAGSIFAPSTLWLEFLL
ncbi:hypothetical protein K443DRAFT_492654 [Laccaria amethystina LaAM-08-1]|uniref:Uncharacterized protein n=1 Tax=Laccaria amethystina LaAM-08-1 TaxID=1095629 RepID=A0A0C9WHI3_9AGAR|nr:hypothetical protein K443DRAFT_492654 [Laccaria amethystina LaAM-08-1]